MIECLESRFLLSSAARSLAGMKLEILLGGNLNLPSELSVTLGKSGHYVGTTEEFNTLFDGTYTYARTGGARASLNLVVPDVASGFTYTLAGDMTFADKYSGKFNGP